MYKRQQHTAAAKVLASAVDTHPMAAISKSPVVKSRLQAESMLPESAAGMTETAVTLSSPAARSPRRAVQVVLASAVDVAGPAAISRFPATHR